jgi:hypothetical protein
MFRLFFPPLFINLLLTFLIQCANPVDDPPLRWETNAGVPISNKSFFLKEEFDNLFDWDSMKVVDPRPTDKDSLDTMVFSIERFTTNLFETTQDSLKNNRIKGVLGPITIVNTPPIVLSSQIPSAQGQFSVPFTATLDSVYNVTFDDTPLNQLIITVANNSFAQLNNIIISTSTLGSDTIATIAPNSMANASIPVHGKSTGHTIAITLSALKGTGSGIISLTMGIANLTASSIKANDRLLQFKREFTSRYEITDTVAIDYVDLSNGFFHYEISNSTDIPLIASREHYHLWISDFCKEHKLNNLKDFNGLSHSDSVDAYYGNASNNGIIVQPNVTLQIEKSNLSSTRLFTFWDSSLNKTVTEVKYIIQTAPPRGDTITLASSDSIVFVIWSEFFQFKEFLGTTKEKYVRSGDTQKVFLDVPWNRSALDSLRGRFILQKVIGNIVADPILTDSLSYIDTMKVNFVVFSPESLAIKDSSSVIFTHVCNDSSFSRSVDITDVTNLFPDTIYVASKMTIPVGTKMKVRNDLTIADPDYSKYIGRMRIRLNNNYFFNSDLDWLVKDTVTMDLGSGNFKVPEALRYVRKLESKKAWFNALIGNHSNLNLYLFALLAPQSRMKALDSIDGNRFTYLLNHPDSARAHGFVHFLGTKGIFIPKRDSTYASEVVWDNDALDSIVMSDSCKWRWQLRFVPGSRDALQDVDYLKINSSFRVQGINNMDSLFIW